VPRYIENDAGGGAGTVAERFRMFAEPTHVGALKRMKLLRPTDRAEALRRVVIAMLIGWLPLAVLAMTEALLGDRAGPLGLFADFAMYAQMLIAVPLLIACEYTMLPALGEIGWHFADSSMIPPDAQKRFEALVVSTRRASAGVWPSVTLGVVVYAIDLAIFLFQPRDLVPPWQRSADGTRVSLAGLWHLLVSLPLVMGLVFAWLWRLGIWMRFLAAVARMPLGLIASHPDRVAGLQFVASSTRLFVPLAFAISVIGAGTFANEVFHQGLSPIEHSVGPLVTVLVVVALFLCPPLVFSPALMRAWQAGMLRYGELARRLGAEFEAKWMRPGSTVDPDALTVQDFSATTDLYGVASNVYAMRVVLFDLRAAIAVAVAALLPFVPIWLSAIPAKTIIDHLVGLVL
jgi:hypothetical protein